MINATTPVNHQTDFIRTIIIQERGQGSKRKIFNEISRLSYQIDEKFISYPTRITPNFRVVIINAPNKKVHKAIKVFLERLYNLKKNGRIVYHYWQKAPEGDNLLPAIRNMIKEAVDKGIFQLNGRCVLKH